MKRDTHSNLNPSGYERNYNHTAYYAQTQNNPSGFFSKVGSGLQWFWNKFTATNDQNQSGMWIKLEPMQNTPNIHVDENEFNSQFRNQILDRYKSYPAPTNLSFNTPEFQQNAAQFQQSPVNSPISNKPQPNKHTANSTIKNPSTRPLPRLPSGYVPPKRPLQEDNEANKPSKGRFTAEKESDKELEKTKIAEDENGSRKRLADTLKILEERKEQRKKELDRLMKNYSNDKKCEVEVSKTTSQTLKVTLREIELAIEPLLNRQNRKLDERLEEVKKEILDDMMKFLKPKLREMEASKPICKEKSIQTLKEMTVRKAVKLKSNNTICVNLKSVNIQPRITKTKETAVQLSSEVQFPPEVNLPKAASPPKLMPFQPTPTDPYTPPEPMEVFKKSSEDSMYGREKLLAEVIPKHGTNYSINREPKPVANDIPPVNKPVDSIFSNSFNQYNPNLITMPYTPPLRVVNAELDPDFNPAPVPAPVHVPTPTSVPASPLAFIKPINEPYKLPSIPPDKEKIGLSQFTKPFPKVTYEYNPNRPCLPFSVPGMPKQETSPTVKMIPTTTPFNPWPPVCKPTESEESKEEVNKQSQQLIFKEQPKLMLQTSQDNLPKQLTFQPQPKPLFSFPSAFSINPPAPTSAFGNPTNESNKQSSSSPKAMKTNQNSFPELKSRSNVGYKPLTDFLPYRRPEVKEPPLRDSSPSGEASPARPNPWASLLEFYELQKTVKKVNESPKPKSQQPILQEQPKSMFPTPQEIQNQSQQPILQEPSKSLFSLPSHASKPLPTNNLSNQQNTKSTSWDVLPPGFREPKRKTEDDDLFNPDPKRRHKAAGGKYK